MEQSFEPLESVGRVLDVLEAFDGAGAELGVSECAKLTGINKSTVYRILATLEQRGYVRQDARSGRYLLTHRWWRIGRHAMGANGLVAVAHPHLIALRERFGETVLLAVYGGDGTATYVDVVDGSHPVRSTSEVGARVPATVTSAGKMLLAHQPESERRRVAQTLHPFTPASIVDPAAFLAELQITRERGYALNRGEFRSGVSGVSVIVGDDAGLAIAAVGLCLPDFRFESHPMSDRLGALRATSAGISRELGYGKARATA